MLSSNPAHQAPPALRAALTQAAQAGEPIMGQVLAQTSAALTVRAAQTRTARDRDVYLLGVQLLQAHAVTLVERYPAALAAAWGHGGGLSAEPAQALASIHFDELELMDSEQVQGRVDLAKTQQVILLAVDGALAELNGYVSGLLGLGQVQPGRNPLRPEIFCEVLQRLLVQTQAPVAVRTEWLRHMSEPLGQALAALYKKLSQDFRKNGVVPAVVAFGAVRQSPGAVPSVASQPSPHAASGTLAQASPDPTLLTLERLRGLLLGELDAVPTHGGPLTSATAARQQFANQFSRQFEDESRDAPATDFQSTVPAALQALQDMQQVDHMVDRLGQRHAQSGESERMRLQRSAQGLGQLLSLEVVGLMVDNIASDVRWLAPVRAVVKNLEPALLSLALVDRRFFSDKQHPARRLLQELTHRSLAFEVADGPGYMLFWATVEQAVHPLLITRQVDSAQPFEHALQALLQGCEARASRQQTHEAVQVLQKAEERHLLAEKIAQDVSARLDADALDPRVVSFLVGPWVQVIAQARLLDATGSDDPGHYMELIAALSWSAQPAKTSANVTRLTQLVPKLLGKLREGLALIDYPAVKTSAFFDVLMKLHQRAFRPSGGAGSAGFESSLLAGLAPSLLEDDDLWLAPAEAKLSGFMSLPDVVSGPASLAQSLDLPLESAGLPIPCTDPAPESALGVSAWVELWVNGAWVRTQVSWASPHGTLFLFTSAQGSTQSMTRRSRDRMWAQGHLRLVSGQPVVDGALDAVLETAMRNSLSLKP